MTSHKQADEHEFYSWSQIVGFSVRDDAGFLLSDWLRIPRRKARSLFATFQDIKNENEKLRARLSSPSVLEGELLQRINRHIGQLSPHIKERETAQLLIAAYEALRVGELPKDLPSRFHAVWNDGFRDYTKEQLAWVFFQKGAESMLAQSPSAPPEAGKDVQSESGIEQLSGYDPWDVGDDEPPSAQGEAPVRLSPELRARLEAMERHPSPVAQGATSVTHCICFFGKTIETCPIHGHPSHPTGSDEEVRIALYDLLGQLESFCRTEGEADFETRRARIALGLPVPPKPTAPDGG